MVNTKTGFGMTLQDCAVHAGAVIVYCSLYDLEWEGGEEQIVIEYKGRMYTFSHIQRAKSFLLSLSQPKAGE
jgi:hypothetical protein